VQGLRQAQPAGPAADDHYVELTLHLDSSVWVGAVRQ
jgi:hypothetical protein